MVRCSRAAWTSRLKNTAKAAKSASWSRTPWISGRRHADAVNLALVLGRPPADLTIKDNSPEAFKGLSHAHTLFIPCIGQKSDLV